MSWYNQPQLKRAKTTKDTSQTQDSREELSQVTGLVEKRRLQNRISQRNYRKYQFCKKYISSPLTSESGNKIRDRLEALEALVEKTAKGEAATDSNTRSPRNLGEATEQGHASPSSGSNFQLQGQASSPVLAGDHSNQWDSMQNFLDAPAGELDSLYDFTDPPSASERYHPGSNSPGSFANNNEYMSVNLPSPASTAGPTPSKNCENVDSEDQTLTKNAVVSPETPLMHPEAISRNDNSYLQQQKQQQYSQFNFNCPFPISLPLSPVSPAFYPRKFPSLQPIQQGLTDISLDE